MANAGRCQLEQTTRITLHGRRLGNQWCWQRIGEIFFMHGFTGQLTGADSIQRQSAEQGDRCADNQIIAIVDLRIRSWLDQPLWDV